MTTEEKISRICVVMCVDVMRGGILLEHFGSDWGAIYKAVSECGWYEVPPIYVDLIFQWMVDEGFIINVE